MTLTIDEIEQLISRLYDTIDEMTEEMVDEYERIQSSISQVITQSEMVIIKRSLDRLREMSIQANEICWELEDVIGDHVFPSYQTMNFLSSFEMYLEVVYDIVEEFSGELRNIYTEGQFRQLETVADDLGINLDGLRRRVEEFGENIDDDYLVVP